MIRDRWYVVLESHEITSKPLGATRLGEPLVFWRRPDGSPVALSDACPHRGAALSAGAVVDGCVQCPFHGFRFDADGDCTHIPAHGEGGRIPRAMHSRPYPLREAHGLVWMWWGEPRAEYPPLPWFEALDQDSWRYSSFAIDAAIHYTRAVENQLDFTHLPFVHRKTIGRFVEGTVQVQTRVDGDRITAWIGEEGSVSAGAGGMVDWWGPSIWMNPIGSGQTVFLAFVPVDDKTTRLYARHYQHILRVPGLDWLYGQAMNIVNRMILREDLRVVETQIPRVSALRSDEVLIPSDRPIIAFRRWMAGGGAAERAQRPSTTRIISLSEPLPPAAAAVGASEKLPASSAATARSSWIAR